MPWGRSRVPAAETRREARRPQRRADRVFQELHDHRRPRVAAIARAALDEDLLHHACEPQWDPEPAPELDREPASLQAKSIVKPMS